MGLHYQMSRADLLYKLLGKPTLQLQPHYSLTHGCIMEPLHIKILEDILLCHIDEKGMHISSQYTHFSPGGAGVIGMLEMSCI